jgi:hypothetical protein
MYLGPQIAKTQRVTRKVHKSNIYLGPQVLRIYDLRKLVADHSALKMPD